MSEQPAPRTLTSLDELLAAEGTVLGTSSWVLVDQGRIDAFAEATGDFQWIHVDVERAEAGPYGSTIAHGYLTLSLLPMLSSQVISFEGWSAALNYGLDKVRFLTPVKSGSRVRVRVELTSVAPGEAGVRIGLRQTVEIEGEERPACVADTLVLAVA